MDLARVKYCIEHIDAHPEAMEHCNGVDLAYFLPEDVRNLVAAVETLTAENAEQKKELEKILKRHLTPRSEIMTLNIFEREGWYENKVEELEARLTATYSRAIEDAARVAEDGWGVRLDGYSHGRCDAAKAIRVLSLASGEEKRSEPNPLDADIAATEAAYQQLAIIMWETRRVEIPLWGSLSEVEKNAFHARLLAAGEEVTTPKKTS